MLVKSDERVPLARLLKFMELGEQIAHSCAHAQAALAPEPGMQTFLAGQARQEKFHALSFKWAIGWLAPRHIGPVPFLKPLEQYRQRLDAAIQQKNFIELLLAEQIILEGLGEGILKKIEMGLVKRHAPFQRLRRMLIHQEEAHHAFGTRALRRALDRQETTVECLRDQAQEYLALAETMMTSVTDLFVAIDEDPNEYITAFHEHLPDWLTPAPIAEGRKLATLSEAEGF